MPRIRVAKLGEDRYQVAVLPNNPRELPARMANAKGMDQVKAAIKQLHGEWDSARRQRQEEQIGT